MRYRLFKAVVAQEEYFHCGTPPTSSQYYTCRNNQSASSLSEEGHPQDEFFFVPISDQWISSFFPQDRSFSIEFGVTDSKDTRRRIAITSAVKVKSIQPLHARFPFPPGIPRDRWLNLIVDVGRKGAASLKNEVIVIGTTITRPLASCFFLPHASRFFLPIFTGGCCLVVLLSRTL